MEIPIIISTLTSQYLKVNESKVCVLSSNQYSVFKLKIIDHIGNFSILFENEFLGASGKISSKSNVYEIKINGDGFSFHFKNKILTINQESTFKIKKYTFKERLAVVHWGGDHRLTDDDYLTEGAKNVLSMGINKIKIYAGKKSDKTYFTSYNSKSPKEIVSQENYRSVFSMGFTNIVIVAHSNVGKSSTYWKYRLTDDQLAEETKQMHDLAMELGKHPHIKFIVTNWEGDCMINVDKTTENYQKMIKWIQARQEGFLLANQPNVKHGIEVNFVLQSIYGHKSVLTEVVPYVKTDYVSYSCYDCKNYQEVNSSIELIKSKTEIPIIIGEFGTPVNNRSSEDSSCYINSIIQVVEKHDIELCCYWQIYDNEFDKNGVPKGFGLINPEGKVTGIWALFNFFL